MKSILLTLTIVTVLSIGITAPIFAQSTTLDLTTPQGDKISGGDKKGTLDLNVKNDTVVANAQMTEPVAEGQVYEGWV